MADDLALNDDNDIAFDGENVVIIEGPQVTRQRLLVRLSSQKGQWFLDINLGVPYFEYVFGADFDADLITINSVFLEVILGTPGVLRMYSPIEFTVDRPNRILGISFKVIDESNVIVPVAIPGLSV